MTCRDLDRALSEMNSMTPEAADHLRSCRRCRDLVARLEAPAEAPSPEVIGRIQHAVTADLRAVAPLAPLRYYVAMLGAVFLLVVLIGGIALARNGVAAMSVLQIVVVLSALLVTADILIVVLTKEMTPGSARSLPSGALPAAAIVLLTLAMASLFPLHPEPAFWTRWWICWRAGAAFGFLAAAPLWLVVRRGAMLSPALTGATLGMLAGLVGTSVLELHCPDLELLHILLAHAGVAVAGCLAGFLTGWLADRARSSA